MDEKIIMSLEVISGFFDSKITSHDELIEFLENVTFDEEILSEERISIFLENFSDAYFIAFNDNIINARVLLKDYMFIKTLKDIESEVFRGFLDGILEKYRKYLEMVVNTKLTDIKNDLIKMYKRTSDLNAFVHMSLLHLAVITRNNEAISYLVHNGADINKVDKDNKFSPMSLAINKNFLSQVIHLKELGAEFSVKDVILAFQNKNCNRDMIEYFLTLDLNITQDVTMKSFNLDYDQFKEIYCMKAVYQLDLLSVILENSDNKDMFKSNEELLCSGEIPIYLRESMYKPLVNLFKLEEDLLFSGGYQGFSKKFARDSVIFGIKDMIIPDITHHFQVRENDIKIVLMFIELFPEFNVYNIKEILNMEEDSDSIIYKLNIYANNISVL